MTHLLGARSDATDREVTAGAEPTRVVAGGTAPAACGATLEATG